MMIQELILSSFGKFKGKKLILHEGLNIIYGENESGKTTTHKFIEGMFFGFFKPYSKRRTYTEEYNKYFPMDQNEYYGILKYKYKEKTYRVERNFIKENSELKVFDDETGEDITHIFKYDNVSRLHDPMSIHMNLNRIVFNNTISVGQLDSKTDKELAKEVKDNLINLGGSLDEDISVKRVIEKLDKQINDIGTEKRIKTSPYGKIIDEIATLEEEKKNALLILREIDEYIENLNTNKIELETDIDKENDRYRYYIEAKKLIQEIKELEVEAKLLSKYNEISTEDYTEIIKLNSSVESLKERKEHLLNKEIELDQKINLLNDKIKMLSESSMDNNIKFDFYTYEEKENELKVLKENKSTIDLKDYKDEIRNKEIKKKQFKSLRIFSLIIVAVTLILTTIISWKVLIIGSLFIMLIIYSFKVEKELDLKAKNTNKDIMNIESKENKEKARIENLEAEMKSILDKYNINSKIDLKIKIDELDNDYGLKYKYDGLQKQKEDLNVEIEEINQILEGTEENRAYILEKNQLKDTHEFKDALARRDKYKNLVSIMDSKKLIFKNTKENIKSLHQSVRDIAYIEEDINRKEIEKKKYEEELSALNLAKTTIENVSRNIQKDFSPKLNNIVSGVLSSITNEKYKDVKIDENLDIKIVDTRDRLVNIEKLSGGTIEQIYLATRLGINEILNGNENLPLILDDSFIQYDETRLENILKFLYRESLNRQIIIFTCQKREKGIIDKLNLDHSFIEV